MKNFLIFHFIPNFLNESNIFGTAKYGKTIINGIALFAENNVMHIMPSTIELFTVSEKDKLENLLYEN